MGVMPHFYTIAYSWLEADYLAQIGVHAHICGSSSWWLLRDEQLSVPGGWAGGSVATDNRHVTVTPFLFRPVIIGKKSQYGMCPFTTVATTGTGLCIWRRCERHTKWSGLHAVGALHCWNATLLSGLPSEIMAPTLEGEREREKNTNRRNRDWYFPWVVEPQGHKKSPAFTAKLENHFMEQGDKSISVLSGGVGPQYDTKQSLVFPLFIVIDCFSF